MGRRGGGEADVHAVLHRLGFRDGNNVDADCDRVEKDETHGFETGSRRVPRWKHSHRAPPPKTGRARSGPGTQVRQTMFPQVRELCGQGQDRTVDLPLFRGSIAPCAIQDRESRQPLLPAYWLVRANESILAAVPPCAGECRIACGYLVGITHVDPDLWGFCGGAGDALAAGLPASGKINGSTPCAAQPSRSVPAWLAPLGAETHLPTMSQRADRPLRR